MPYLKLNKIPTSSFVRRVNTITRRKYTVDVKIRIVLEGLRREVTLDELCRREGVKPYSSYVWAKDSTDAGKERLPWTM